MKFQQTSFSSSSEFWFCFHFKLFYREKFDRLLDAFHTSQYFSVCEINFKLTSSLLQYRIQEMLYYDSV